MKSPRLTRVMRENSGDADAPGWVRYSTAGGSADSGAGHLATSSISTGRSGEDRHSTNAIGTLPAPKTFSSSRVTCGADAIGLRKHRACSTSDGPAPTNFKV